MSVEAQLGLGAGIALLVVIALLILKWDSRTPPDDQIQDEYQQLLWAQLAEKAVADFGLGATRAAGEKWAATIAGLLGVLSAVAFVAGPSNLVEDVGADTATIAGILILVAGAVAILATLLAALAEHGTPLFGEDALTAGRYRALLRTRAKRATEQIRWSRYLTVLALGLIFTATGVAWLSALTAPEGDTGQSAIVTSSSGTRCGVLVATGDDVQLRVGTTNEPIAADARLTLVDACPKESPAT